MATEKRLIAFDPVTFESFTRHATKHREPYDQYDMGYVDAVDNIESWMEANTVDAVEVVHGRWGAFEVFPGAASLNGYPCSVCGNRVLAALYNLNYCPNCGAKMDGGESK